MVPIGRGQRELILGDRYVGKTCIGVDILLNQKYEKVFCVFLPIAQKASSILNIFISLVKRNSMCFASFVVASASSSTLCHFLSAYTGTRLYLSISDSLES